MKNSIMQSRFPSIRFSQSVAFVLTFVVFACFFNKAAKADNDLDSLKNAIEHSKNSINRADAYVELSEIVYQTNRDSVIILCTYALRILDTALVDSSRASHRMVLNIKAHALNNIGYVFYSKGDMPKALDYYYEGLKLREAAGDKKGIAESLNNLGVLYKSQGNISKAIETYQKSLDLYTDVKDIEGEATAMGNIGVLYTFENKQDTALAYFLKGLNLQQSMGNKQGVVKLLNNIGNIYEKKSQYDEALKYFFKNMDLLKELNDKEDMANTLYNITQVEYNKSDFIKAQQYGENALQLSQELGIPSDIMRIAKLMFEVYNEKKMLADALTMHILYSTMQDSVNTEESRKAVLQKEFQFEYGKKEAEMKAEQEKRDLISQAESKRQKIAIWLAFIVAIATGTIAILVFRSLKITRKQKLIIEEQKSLVEQKNKDILDSITYAKRLQDAILPSVSLVKKYLPQSFVLYKPKDIVAGDFYWMQHVGDNIFIAACDCTGHGVPGAMVSVVCSGALNRAVKEFHITDPGKILDKTREIVIETFQKSEAEVKDGMDISLAAISYQPIANGHATVKWAGANSPLWYMQNNEVNEIVADKQPIGVQDGQKNFKTNTVTLNKGDVVYMFTDGYIDQFGGPKGKKFKSKPFRELIKTMGLQTMDEQRKILDETFESWKGIHEQTDDVCVIGIRV